MSFKLLCKQLALTGKMSPARILAMRFFVIRGVSESHAQLEGSMSAFKVVIGLLVTISRIFELIPKSD